MTIEQAGSNPAGEPSLVVPGGNAELRRIIKTTEWFYHEADTIIDNNALELSLDLVDKQDADFLRQSVAERVLRSEIGVLSKKLAVKEAAKSGRLRSMPFVASLRAREIDRIKQRRARLMTIADPIIEHNSALKALPKFQDMDLAVNDLFARLQTKYGTALNGSMYLEPQILGPWAGRWKHIIHNGRPS